MILQSNSFCPSIFRYGTYHPATKADIAEIKAEVRLLKWGLGLLILLNGGALAALIRLLGS